MNSRERVAAAFEHQATDKVPVMHVGFSSEVASALLGREAYVGGGIQQWREAVAWWNGEDAHAEFVERSLQDAIDIALYCENDLVRTSYWRYRPKPTRRIDEYTFMYEYGPEENWRVLRFDLPSEQCHIYNYIPEAALTFEDLEKQLDGREKALADYKPSEENYVSAFEARRRLGDEYVIRVGGAGIGIGKEAIWLEATLLRPDLVERRLDIQVDICERNIPFLAQNGFHYIFGGDDFASNDAPFFSPKVFRQLLFPRLKRAADIFHQCGSRFNFASDGNLWPVADDLFGRTGIDGYYEIDRRAGMDMRRLRERFPDLTLIGNINSTDVATLSREEIVAQTLDCVEFAKETTSVIVGASNYFVPGTPIENVMAVLETIAENR